MARKSGKNKGYTYRINKNGTVTCRAYFDMPSGIRKQISATGRTKEESRKELNYKYAEIWKQGKQINSKGYTVETWINYWLLNIDVKKFIIWLSEKLIEKFADKNFILPLYDFENLNDLLKKIKKFKPQKYKSNTNNMIQLIENYIDNN